MADYKYKEYQESDAVRQAKAALDAQAAQKPGAYQSQWQQSLNDTINKIQNREKFSYNLNGDALYQQYKDRYVQQGQMAMMDTMGQAAALTGGYGSSYGQSVGQQAYQGYLQQLNDKVPELYQLALNQYNQEGQDLYNQYAMLGERESTDYSRHRDSVGDWQSERDYLSGQYNAERDYDYGKYSDERNFDYGKYTDDRNYQYQVDRDQVTDTQWQKEYDEAVRQYDKQFGYQEARDKVLDERYADEIKYQQGRDEVSDTQWKAEFDEALRQYNESLQYQKDRDTTSNNQWQAEFDEAKRQYDEQYNKSNNTTSKVTTTTGTSYDTHGYRTEDIKAMQRAAGIEADGIWGPQTQAAWDAGYTKDGKAGDTDGFTGTTYSEAVAAIKAKGVSNDAASMVMTKSEWVRARNSGSSRHGASEFNSYEEYLAYIVDTST